MIFYLGTKKISYSAFPGRVNLITWEVIHPIKDGNCTIKLSDGTNDFQTLYPSFESQQSFDSNTFGINEYFKVNRDGSFPCGRVDPRTFERVTVKLPNYTCRSCTLQLAVDTLHGNLI